jgi:NAD(P)H-dependent FMN reductase
MIHASSPQPANVLVVLGSVRAGRRCPQIAAWLIDIAAAAGSLHYEILDLADWPLPMDDEPGIPATGAYSQTHTLAFSAKIAAADAFLFVAPQYNWGYTAVLKNAIDHLYTEWSAKPAVIVTYGSHGGGKCAVQLRQVLEGVHMHPVATMPAISLSRAAIMGGPVDPATDFLPFAADVRQAITELTAALEPAPRDNSSTPVNSAL